MKRYEDMSDFEINTEVAKIVTGGDVICADNMFPAPSKFGVQVVYKIGIHGEFYDYCNNPSDAWGLMVVNEVSLIALGDEWEACRVDDYGDESHNITQAKPGRAVAICFLRMKDVENG